jgi:hypothetical protein
MKQQSSTPQPDGIMTRDELAAWLKVAPRQIDRLGIPCIDLGKKTKRYFVKDVAAWLESSARGTSKRGQNEERGAPTARPV